ncbi:MAG TPA: 4Fe-4S binding protein [Candidatus Aminicenantes bacterium]|nr:4Fe-4S binding protein [Candidatus Aminicenantes bacterium]
MRLAVTDAQLCVGCQCCMFACSRRQGIAGLGQSCIQARSAGGMSRGFQVVVCRACPDPPCARACPEGALEPRPGGGVVLRKERCTGCGLCRPACIIGAVFWDPCENRPLICIHCGYCSRYCPHGVLRLEKREEG